MDGEFLGFACLLAFGLALMAQEQFVIGKLAGVVVLLGLGVYEWRCHFGKSQDHADRKVDISQSQYKN